jgi:hypothetical protein
MATETEELRLRVVMDDQASGLKPQPVAGLPHARKSINRVFASTGSVSVASRLVINGSSCTRQGWRRGRRCRRAHLRPAGR